MSEATFQLVFRGETLAGFEPATVRAALGQRLRADRAQQDRLWSGKRVVIKRDLRAEVAAHWVAQFAQLGALLHSEAMGAAPPARPPLSLARRDPDLTQPPPESEPPATQPADPEALAAEKAAAEAERQRRRADFMARHGLDHGRETRDTRSPAEPDRSAWADEDTPPLFATGFKGRMGRLRAATCGTLLMSMLLGMVILLIASPSIRNLLLLLLGYVVVAFWGVRATVLRLHDMNLSGWWGLLSFLPFIGGLFSLALSFWPGSADDNDHGPVPEPGSGLVLLGATLLMVFCVFVLTAKALSFMAKAGGLH